MTHRSRTGLRTARVAAPVMFLVALPFVAPDHSAAAVPPALLDIYTEAAGTARCDLPHTLLIAIGEIESKHGTVSAADDLVRGQAPGTAVLPVSTPPIVGAVLDGSNGTALVDADGDGIAGGEGDRARGMMQILPTTAKDLGINDPGMLQDVEVSVRTAAAYLCRNGVDTDLHRAILAYNPSQRYLNAVLTAMSRYEALLGSSTSPAP